MSLGGKLGRKLGVKLGVKLGMQSGVMSGIHVIVLDMKDCWLSEPFVC